MTRYTPEFIAALRQRYENTDQLMTSIAAEFEISVRTLGRMRLTEGWRKRSERTRGLPIAVHLLEQAKALAKAGGQEADPSPPPATQAEGSEPTPTAIDRMEALVVNEIEAEEAARAQLLGKRRVTTASERSARTLATLTQTLHTLQRMRAGHPPEPEILADDDMPRDIDEFRRDLARRIDAFVASRTDAAHADEDSGDKPVAKAG